jgi:serine/threonine protein kinase/Tfp pilus assembly protein PilF
MTPELWQRLKPLFHAALEQNAEDRAAFITSACNGDLELQAHLNKLLEAEAQSTGSLSVPFVPARDFASINSTRFQAGEMVLGRFRIARLIGHGGMGEVYEAEDLQLGRIALKTMRREIALSPSAFDRFRQEVLLARKITGPQVCRIHELFLLPASDGHETTVFLTMEYLDGETLAARLARDGPIPWKEAHRIALDLCEGLRLIHAEGIIHRDLKSGNIMLCPHSKGLRTVLMDFGLAQDFTPASPGTHGAAKDLDGPPRIVGTPEYMAPEQFEGGTVSPATDIYALGIVLYEMITGVHPYAGPTPIAAAIRRARHPASPSTVVTKVPPQWDRVVEGCLEYEPSKRFQSAEEVAQRLRPGFANLRYLHKDRPWVFRAACALLLFAVGWSTYRLWQIRHYYHPSTEALRWYDAGVAALHEGSNIKATRALQQALAEDDHFVMAHARLAEAWANLDFDGNAQHEFLAATPGGPQLNPVDRMYLEAIHATVTKDHPSEIKAYRQILDHLPTGQKSWGYVDLGMAYERAGDPNHALECYKRAISLNNDYPAPFMHIAVLQSRQRHGPEADQAFRRAQALLSADMNQEGLAELDYERGYAANDGGDPALARGYLEKALDEATAIPSIQLQIRTLTQLGSVAAGLDRYEQAVKYANEAIDLAQANRLDAWAANGYVRLASAELQQGHLQQAEVAVQKALQLSRQTEQHRVEAMANVTLASLMNQKHLPDQMIAPAQAALEYYQQNGFFVPATNASLLLVRAQRDRGEYPQALEAGKASLELSTKSGNRQLMMLSEEVVGTVFFNMEHYPDALVHFQNALSMASTTNARAYQTLHCAGTLARLGRYREFDALLQQVPNTETFGLLMAEMRILSLLSSLKYAQANEVAEKTLISYPSMAEDDKLELLEDEALAEAHLGKTKQALALMNQISSQNSAQGAANDWRRDLVAAEIYLSLGKAQQARDLAAKTADHFASTGQRTSELRSLCLMAAASKTLKDSQGYESSSQKIIDILAELKHTWDPKIFVTYFSRPDFQALVRGINLSAL